MTARVDVDALIAALDAKRQSLSISWRKVATETGVNASTLTRMHQGKNPDVNTFLALVDWLHLPAEQFTRGAKPKGSSQAEEMPIAATLLRGKRKLDKQAMKALEDLVQAAYKVAQDTK
jgi:transcriptional regulator with XRE-family HTH domain